MSTLFAAVLMAATVAGTALQEPQPDVTIYRSWRSPNVTAVEGLFRVDPALLGTGSCAYGVRLTVRDSAGTQLKQEEWTGRCPEQNGQPAAALETFQFQVVPARYTVQVEVFPQGEPGRIRTRTLEVRGLAGNPLVSDLILARKVGFVDDTTQATTWTHRRGTVGLQLSSHLIVEPADPELSYYLELYPAEGRPMSGAVFGLIRRADGKELTRARLQQLNAVADPLPVAGAFPLAGLAPGDYVFETQVQLADTTITRSHPFTMGGAVAVAASSTGWFGTLSDEQLAELFDPVVVWLAALVSRDDADMYPRLTPAGKREFLARQFGTLGPTPNDGDESALDDYVARVRLVNSRFGERAGRGAVEPWRTDRGRIFLLRGEPSAQVQRPSPASRAAYEIWHYSVGQGLVYLFADETKMGHYRLIYSNDPAEQPVPNWTSLVAAEAMEDLARLGFRPAGGGS